METESIKSEIIKHLSYYESALESYTLASFTYKNNEATWSLCQLYDHLTISNAFFFMANTQRCLEKRKGQMGGQKEIQGEYVLSQNSMGKGRYKGPSATEQPCAGGNDSIGHYRELLKENKEDVHNIGRQLKKPYSQDYKCRHGRFGWLNATEWFQLMEIHLRHHLRQHCELVGFATLS